MCVYPIEITLLLILYFLTKLAFFLFNSLQHKTKDADNEEITKYVFNMVTPLVCPAVKLACEVTYDKKTFNLASLSRRVGQVRDGENV